MLLNLENLSWIGFRKLKGGTELDKGYPWDSYQEDVREYGAQDLANAFGKIMKNGVVNRLTDFLVSPQTGNVVRVGAGEAWINGHTVSVLGFEDVEIPYGGAATDGKTYGRLVLQAREETAYRDFRLVYKPPVNDETPEAEDGEISIARIASKRESEAVTISDIIRDVTAAACVNAKIMAGDYTDVSGLLKGKDGKIDLAVPGTDYIPISGGTFTGNIYQGEAQFQTIKRDKSGDWLVEKYQDGYIRAYYTKQIDDMFFNRCGTAPVYLGEATGGDISLPIKFQNPIVKIWGSGSYLILNEQKYDSYQISGNQAIIRLGRWYLIKYFEPAGGVDIDSSTTRLYTSVKVCISVEGYSA